MKKILFIVSIFAISACSRLQSKQQKAEVLVKNYLKTVLNDPSSYEGIAFDTLSTFYKSYATGDPNGRKLDTLAASFIDSSAKYSNLAKNELSTNTNIKKYNHHILLSMLFQKKSDSVENIEKIKGKGYKGNIYAYGISHTYRAKNGFGGLVINKTDFRIDSTITKVLNVETEH